MKKTPKVRSVTRCANCKRVRCVCPPGGRVPATQPRTNVTGIAPASGKKPCRRCPEKA